MMAFCWALPAIMAPYLITKPSHVHALVAIFCLVCFGKSAINYSDATDMEISSSVLAVFVFAVFFAAVTHSPLSWLSLILHADPSNTPVSGRPTPISHWFRRSRQLIPPDAGSQAPDAALASARKSKFISDLLDDLKAAYSLNITYVRYVEMYEESQQEIAGYKDDIEALKGDIETHKDEVVCARAERDIAKKETASEKARVDKCEKVILDLMEKRDQRIQSRVCRWCKSKVNRVTRALENVTKKHDDGAATETDAAKAMAEKDRIIAEKDKIISAKGEEALAATASARLGGGSRQASLFAHIGALDEKLRAKDLALYDRDCEIARLNSYINFRRFCCCGRCGGGAPPAGPNDDDDDHTNGGPPQGGNAQPPTPAIEPSGAPPCPVGEPSNPPPTTGTPPSDDDGVPVPPAPTTPLSSPLSSLPASPASIPEPLVPLPPSLVPHLTYPIPVAAALTPLPTSPVPGPVALVPPSPPDLSLPPSPVPEPAGLVSLPTSPVASTVPPASVPVPPASVPAAPASVPAPTVLFRATPGFGPSSSLFVPGAPPTTGTSGPQPPGT